jgi:hypothetical protein
MIRKQLTDRARDFNIIMDDVAITELSFGKDYSAAGRLLYFSVIGDSSKIRFINSNYYRQPSSK